jgi:precorrin-4/cobalt-precorrin-4 C11-methyltransferase
MKVYFIGAGPGDPELITLRGKNVLSASKICIYAGSLVNPELLGFLPQNAEVFDSKEMSLEDIREIFKGAKQRRLNVARLHTGDISLYSALNEQVNVLDELGIEYEVIPGVSSFQAAAAALKKELTVPEVTQTVILTRLEGRTPVPTSERIEELARSRSTMCIFLSVNRIEKLVQSLRGSYASDTPVSVIYKASWKDQVILNGTLEDIVDKVVKASITMTAVIIVGRVLKPPKTRSKLYDSNFGRGQRI